MSEGKEKILLIQLRQIGDVLMTTPAIKALREVYPNAEITFLTESPGNQLLGNNPHLNGVEIWPGKGSVLTRLRFGLALRRKKFDLVVDFMSGPQSAQITWVTGAPRRVGFAFRGRRWAYTDSLALPPMDYAAEHKTGLLKALGVPPKPPVIPEVFPQSAERDLAAAQLKELGVDPGDLLVMVSPVSRRPYKVWPPRHFARLADVLIERYNAKILFQWGPGEEGFVDAVRLEMEYQALPTYPVPSLMVMAAMMERVDLMVGNDNGPRHFAMAVGTPTVGVFGRPWASSWTPPGQNQHLAIEHDPGCKRKCKYPDCGIECIADLPYKPVEEAVEKLLEGILRHGTPVRRKSADRSSQ